ncbi:hypothetical protein FOCC_FOCC000834 [Frankliniella occidentalis]|nr:hypothetical protein FOCC_FOCC000834 [Frankliniella occidentalis]
MPAELQEVILALRRLGPGPGGLTRETAPARLTRALLLAMRRGNVEHLTDVLVAADERLGGRAAEDCLGEAWRTFCALNLPTGNTGLDLAVVADMVMLRYGESPGEATRDDTPLATSTQARWHELWGRVDLLLDYLRRLEDELERLQRRDRAPGSADLGVMLARMCALALHGVKGSFAATYTDVPWEEMEYLLVMFIEARTVNATWADRVATARSTPAHLRCFRERLEKYVLVHRAEPDPEEAMRRLERAPREERADLLVAVVDSALDELLRDFARLRDWHSLKEISETLRVAGEQALDLEDDAWAAWGWLVVLWGLFVVGERVKYSWLSPNLSPRWARLVEAMVPGGVLATMAAIRDCQGLGKEGSNAEALALPEMKGPERKRMAGELEKLSNAARAALLEAESEVDCGESSDYFEMMRAAKVRSGRAKHLISTEVIRILRKKENAAEDHFNEILSCSNLLQNIDDRDPSHLKLLFGRFVSLTWHFALHHLTVDIPRVCSLLFHRTSKHTESFQAQLCEIVPQPGSSSPDTIVKALKVMRTIPVKGPLTPYACALHGAVRELASRWHEHDPVVPTTHVPFSPTLFGRELRDYLNHLDEVFGSVFRPSFELLGVNNLMLNGPPLLNGARPRLRDLRWSRAENERLLRLLELKSDMFRCAREGDLVWLQRLVVDGADVGVRDCQGRTLLHAAAHGGQVHVVEWLLGLGAEAVDPLAEDWHAYTALHVAGTAPVAEALLAARPVRQAAVQDGAPTPLHAAALEGRAEVVAVLLREPRPGDLAAVFMGMSPLHCAALGGHDRVVRLLLQAGARYPAHHPDKVTPLDVAARSPGGGPAVRVLLQGTRPPPTDEDCLEAASQAARRGHEQPFALLADELSARGRLSPGRHMTFVLYCAGIGGSSAIALRLLDLFSGDGLGLAGRTVLLGAVFKGHRELVGALVDRGVDPLSDDNPQGLTALEGAVLGDSPDTIDALVERIPGVCRQTALSRALHRATIYGRLPTVQRLVHHGAAIDVADRDGTTALARAASVGHIEVVEWLLQQGADPRLGEDPPLLLAAQCGHLDVVELLVPPLPEGRAAHQDEGQAGPSVRLPRLKHGPERSTTEQEEAERLRLLQQAGSGGFTALHSAVAVSALPIVEYLLDREEELLRRVHSKHADAELPRLEGITVYARDECGVSGLMLGCVMLCAPSVAEALLLRMGDALWMALGRKDLQQVRGMAAEALGLAAVQPGGSGLVHALCGWISRSGEGLLGGGGLQDIRRRAVAALGSAGDAGGGEVIQPWNRVLCVPKCVGLGVDVPQTMRRTAQVAMSACLGQGARGEMAVQLLCQWLCDLSGDPVPESVIQSMGREALGIARERGDPKSIEFLSMFESAGTGSALASVSRAFARLFCCSSSTTAATDARG